MKSQIDGSIAAGRLHHWTTLHSSVFAVVIYVGAGENLTYSLNIRMTVTSNCNEYYFEREHQFRLSNIILKNKVWISYSHEYVIFIVIVNVLTA